MQITEIVEKLESYVKQLNQTAADCEKKLQSAPSGSLLIAKVNGRNRYYLRTEARKYLGASQKELIMRLEEKLYYSELLKSVAQKKVQAEKALKVLKEGKDPAQVFLLLPKNKKNLIDPYVLPPCPNASFLNSRPRNRQLEKISSYCTKANEIVRSKSELIIADKLFDAGVPYCYEMATVLGEDPEMMRVSPDFTVMNKRTGKIYYWEHFGMMDNKDYADATFCKLENYSRCGVYPGKNLIITFESSVHTLNTGYLDRVIKEHLL